MTLGQALKHFRKQKDVSVEDLADLIFVHYNTIYKYENGATEPSLTTISEICKALDIKVLDLLKEVDLCND